MPTLLLAKLRSLRDDSSGAILLSAVFFAAFLVGALWYVAGVGNAALFRERMQDGADAAAFASAVYHARGMNIIAMINLIMAAVLAVLVALKIIFVLLTALAIILGIICAIPFCEWACAPAGWAADGAEQTQNIIDKVKPIIHQTLKVLSKLEVGVAVAMPWLAEVKTYTVAVKYSKPVDGGLMLSESLLPSSPRLGLPVQEDSYQVLCDKSKDIVEDVIGKPFEALGLGFVKYLIDGLINGLVQMAPSYFCDGGGGGSGNNKAQLPGNTAQQVCNEQKKQIDKKNQEKMDAWKAAGSKGLPPPLDSFDMQDCLDNQKDSLKDGNKQLQGAMDKSGGSNTDTTGETPKKVIDGAKNGDRNFGITSYIWGDMHLTHIADKPTKMAAWGQSLFMNVPDFWGQVQFAQSEFYYDDKGSWDSLKDKAMWNMRWRARLRRYHPEIAPDQGIIQDVASVVSVGVDVINTINNLQNMGLQGAFDSALGIGGQHLSDVYSRNATKTTGGGFDKLDTSSKAEAIH